MRITVFGANGKVGRIVVTEALGRGHDVLAFCRSEPAFAPDKNLFIVRGDVHDPRAVRLALQSSDAVISALGSWGTPTKDTLASGMRAIVPAMQTARISRVVSLTGADARAPEDIPSPLHRLTHSLIGVVGRKVLQDSEEHIRLLAASHLQWTVIRSPVMTTLGNPVAYTLDGDRPLPWQSIHRRSVALSMLESLEQNNHLQSCPYIKRSK